MTITDILWVLAFIVITAALYYWLFKGRGYGYSALAIRTGELHKNGVNEVFLLYSTTDVGMWAGVNLQFDPIWSFLNTGYLGYFDSGKLIIEFSWWNKIRQLTAVMPDEIAVQEEDFLYATRKKPGVHIGDRAYGVVGVNIENKNLVKQLLKSLDTQNLNSNRQLFETRMTDAGFSVKSSKYVY